MKFPPELSQMFRLEHFSNYPLVSIPQSYTDERGVILNIADGKLGDVAVIYSNRGSSRANHLHKQDWHLSYLVYGSMRYLWQDDSQNAISNSLIVKKGDLVFTPSGVAHKMEFLEDTCFIAVAALHRDSNNYEADTQRLSDDFFKVD